MFRTSLHLFDAVGQTDKRFLEPTNFMKKNSENHKIFSAIEKMCEILFYIFPGKLK